MSYTPVLKRLPLTLALTGGMPLQPFVISPIRSAVPFRFTRRGGQHGFSLVELLVVISIIAVLAAILLSVTQRTKETANASKCVAKLRALGNAVNLYRTDKLAYPKTVEYRGGYTGNFWFTDIAPYLNTTFTQDNDTKDTLYRCPSVKVRPNWPYIDYALNGYSLPTSGDDYPFMKVANPSTTFAVGESDFWTIEGGGYPGDDRLENQFQFRHKNSANVVMFDGHVEKITKEQLADPKFQKQLKGLQD